MTQNSDKPAASPPGAAPEDDSAERRASQPPLPPPSPPSPPSPPLAEFFNEIGIIAQLSSAAFDRVLPEGLTRSQFSVLNHFVRLGGPRSLVALARSFQVTKGAMTNTASKLAAKGLITISPDPKDGRGKLVDITEEGRAMRERALAKLGPLLGKLAEGVDVAEIERMIEPLRRIRRGLDENRDIDPGQKGYSGGDSDGGALATGLPDEAP